MSQSDNQEKKRLFNSIIAKMKGLFQIVEMVIPQIRLHFTFCQPKNCYGRPRQHVLAKNKGSTNEKQGC